MATYFFRQDSVLDLVRSWVVRDRDDSHGPRLLLQPIPPSPQTKKVNLTLITVDGRRKEFFMARKIRSRSRFDC